MLVFPSEDKTICYYYCYIDILQLTYQCTYVNHQIYSQSQIKTMHQNSNSIFSLIRLKPQCKMVPTRVDFTQSQPIHQPSRSITPAFNPDHHFFTSTFILPLDHKVKNQNIQFEKCQFEEKVQQCLEQNQSELETPPAPQFIVAVPNSKYCQICQEKYEDYHTHISLKPHALKINKSQCLAKIQSLCQQFRNTSLGAYPNRKTKGIKKEHKKQYKDCVSMGVVGRSDVQTQKSIKNLNMSTCVLQSSMI